jgi:hypothetical protein
MFRCAIGLAGLSLLASGCLTSVTGNNRLCREAPQLKTKAQILQNLGGPAAVRALPDGKQDLVYVATEQYGGGIGAGYSVFKLLVVDQDRETDKVTFTVAPDGKVVGCNVENNTQALRYSAWPF